MKDIGLLLLALGLGDLLGAFLVHIFAPSEDRSDGLLIAIVVIGLVLAGGGVFCLTHQTLTLPWLG